MKRIVFVALAVAGSCAALFLWRGDMMDDMPKVVTLKDIQKFFPKTVEEIEVKNNRALEQLQQDVQKIIALKTGERTFENTVLAFDRLNAKFQSALSSIFVLTHVHPNAVIRDAAQKAVIQGESVFVDLVSNNKHLYEALKEYNDSVCRRDSIDSEQCKYLDEVLQGYQKSGFDLPDEQQEEVKNIKKELQLLQMQFDANIAQDKSCVVVSRDELAGVPESCVSSLKTDDEGNCILSMDYPTLFSVMQNCSVESTRRAYNRAFSNRAYPANEEILKKVAALRHRLAQLLGFKTFAHVSIDDEMAKTPERVREFLNDLIEKSEEKMAQEYQELTQNLPEGVALTEDGKLKHWDVQYMLSQHKKRFYAVDEEYIQEYLPTDHVVDTMLSMYSQFLDVDFKRSPAPGLWHEDVEYIQVYKKDGSFVGTVLFDLFPRADKFSHACNEPLVPSVCLGDELYPGLVLLIANFPEASADRPSLLKRSDVKTLLHEFGHAMHALFGVTKMAGFSGFSVKYDFVEVPSQLFEEWLSDPTILKMITKHYKTGECLPDDIIEKINLLKSHDAGYFVKRQSALSLLALEFFSGADKDGFALKKELWSQIMPFIAPDSEDHFVASFGHLMGYGARYYCYLWSKVYSVDLFEHIKKHGVLNPEVGRRYRDIVIGKGASVEPDRLVEEFLGRPVRADAFFTAMKLQ